MGQERDIYPSCGSTQPDGKGIHRKQKPKEEGFLRLDEGGGVFIAEGGGMQGRSLLSLSLPHALQTKPHTEEKKEHGRKPLRQMRGENCRKPPPCKKKQLHHEKGFYREQKKGGRAKADAAQTIGKTDAQRIQTEGKRQQERKKHG